MLLPSETEEDLAFIDLYTTYKDILQSGRNVWEISETEEAIIRTIAQQKNASSFDAQALLLLALGEEFPIHLPAVPEFLNEALQDQLSITFKQSNTDFQLDLYPNPAKENVFVKFSCKNDCSALFEIIDINGRVLVSKQMTSSNQKLISTKDFANGIYFYRLIKNGKVLSRNKIVVFK